MTKLDTLPTLTTPSQPTLWHPDLHMGNIFIDENERIVSLIDLQSISILPAFLQAEWPIFLKPPRNYTKGPVRPELPDNFHDLDEDDQILAERDLEQAKVAKVYELQTYLNNEPK